MKRYNHLWEKICTIDNFKQAYKNATKGKKYYTEVKQIELYGVDKYLEELLEEVVQNKYKVSEYTVFKRFTGGKEREIFKLPMKDRIVLHAIMIHIEPIFRETFILDTYSSIDVSKKVYCYDLLTKTIIESESIAEASHKSGVDYRSVGQICNNKDYKHGGRFICAKRWLFSFDKDDLIDRVYWFFSDERKEFKKHSKGRKHG